MQTLEQRLARHSVDSNGCWRWLGYHNRLGYGIIAYLGKPVGVHRVAYIHYVGAIPEGLEVDHLCKVRDCLNPAHLEAVDRRTNMERSDVWRHNREKTRCSAGHRYDEANTYIDPTGRRHCRTCRAAEKRARRARSRR